MIPHSTVGRVVAAAYVLTVAVLATWGAASEMAGPILVAGLLTLPTSVPAVIGYYVFYGLLAQVPGANPDSSSGSMSCSSAGDCQGSSTGDLATWFSLTTGFVGISALIVCAVVNVALVGSVFRGRPVASARTR